MLDLFGSLLKIYILGFYLVFVEFKFLSLEIEIDIFMWIMRIISFKKFLRVRKGFFFFIYYEIYVYVCMCAWCDKICL